ncbi:ABC transporter ATP-binding protein [Campylobacter hepaticus]|uniref:ABC transporter ATP-binding protein n=1 Tax=Campylobacter hepaticus TaxID=1813019 RepID=A0A424Z1I2_9BACT|nr:ABC transporter ATP-binding protein [Campylobacter hepaticus]AXP09327.1 ABC transporter ATP-binding protein [Campylobacter hepaticus]MCZ0772929.1 ABC transporter ATP-binding protein [Campylobacter hepaticus]MCZ0774398.1 ABC transporter ATP-binding protein [Campylobacter hepaticus]MCZ0775650.1 ABC transporter ATP-binding protein [Campylobacter hepaticus]MDX2323565.1 ABC transporter ATP-binding protein [Campylobacter hepaticus]
MLKIDNLNFSYYKKNLLKNINLELKSQSFIGILGPNGSGKSTLLKLMLKNLKPDSGEISFFNTNIQQFSLKEFSKICGFVPQNSGLNTPLKVIDILLMGKYIHLKHTFSSYTQEDILEITEFSKHFKLENFLERNVLSLSGGEFQRVLLARALLKKPKILFLDEATSALDLNYAIELLSLCEKLIKEKNITVIAILHDLNLASIFCDKIIFLKEGKIQYFGTSKELFTKEILKEIYNLNCEIIYKNSKPYILILKE